MSVQTQERPQVADRIRIEQRTGVQAQPRPRVVVRTRYIERPATKPSLAAVVLGRGAAFSVIALFTFAASSLAGQVMVENARKDLIETKSRTVTARKAEALLRDRVSMLTRADRIEDWASSHGMVAADGLGLMADATNHGANH